MDKQAPLPIAILNLNPCLDVSYEFSSLVPDQKVRADHTRFDPGGNGTNVGRALKQLGLPAINCCILAGEIGILVERMLGDQLAANRLGLGLFHHLGLRHQPGQNTGLSPFWYADTASSDVS